MIPVIWCHCSDAHLGYKQYKLPQRLHDFGSAFNQCINLIIEQQPEFVIFSGDLFEHYNPYPPELRQAIKILSQLKEHGIQLFIIPGNHDVSYSASKRYGGDILHFLQDLGLVHYLHDTYEIVEKEGKAIALIAGLQYYGKKTPKMLEEFFKKNEDAFKRTDIPKILMLHAFVEGTVPNYDISSYALNLYPFDYIAIGHYHLKWPKNFKDKNNKVFSSGGTEHRSSAEWGHSRGFITVKAEDDGTSWIISPEFTTYDVRKKILIKHDFKITTAEEVIRTTRDLIKQNDKKEMILRLILEGILKRGEASFLNIQELKKHAENLLYIDIANHITYSTIGVTPPKTEREAYIEVLKNSFTIKKEYLDSYVALLEDIIKLADDRDFIILISKMLDEFIKKSPDAIIVPKQVEEPAKSPKPKAPKSKKKRKRPKSTKKITKYK